MLSPVHVPYHLRCFTSGAVGRPATDYYDTQRAGAGRQAGTLFGDLGEGPGADVKSLFHNMFGVSAEVSSGDLTVRAEQPKGGQGMGRFEPVGRIVPAHDESCRLGFGGLELLAERLPIDAEYLGCLHLVAVCASKNVANVLRLHLRQGSIEPRSPGC